MKLRFLVGIGLMGIGSLSGGYMLGGIVNTYLPNTIVKVFLFLMMFSSGIYLIIQNRRYFSDALRGYRSDYQ